MKYIIAYDLGTGGVKAALYNEEGVLVNDFFISYQTLFTFCLNFIILF